MSKQFTREEVAKHNKEGDLWVVIDSKVFDLSKFADMHPGGANVLYEEDIGMISSDLSLYNASHWCFAAGQDATEQFFSLHRLEVLLRPQYKRLVIGTIQGAQEIIKARADGALSEVPYAEPSWLSTGYSSPYYKEVSRLGLCGLV